MKVLEPQILSLQDDDSLFRLIFKKILSAGKG